VRQLLQVLLSDPQQWLNVTIKIRHILRAIHFGLSQSSMPWTFQVFAEATKFTDKFVPHATP
jgi:hypothetical protein